MLHKRLSEENPPNSSGGAVLVGQTARRPAAPAGAECTGRNKLAHPVSPARPAHRLHGQAAILGGEKAAADLCQRLRQRRLQDRTRRWQGLSERGRPFFSSARASRLAGTLYRRQSLPPTVAWSARHTAAAHLLLLCNPMPRDVVLRHASDQPAGFVPQAHSRTPPLAKRLQRRLSRPSACARDVHSRSTPRRSGAAANSSLERRHIDFAPMPSASSLSL